MIFKIQEIDRIRECVNFEDLKEGEFLKVKEDDKDVIIKTPFLKIIEVKGENDEPRVFTIESNEEFQKFLAKVYKEMLKNSVSINDPDVKVKIARRIVEKSKRMKILEIEQVSEKFRPYLYKRKHSMKRIEFNTIVNEIFGNTEYGTYSLEKNSRHLTKPNVYLLSRFLLKMKNTAVYTENGYKFIVPKLEILQLEIDIKK